MALANSDEPSNLPSSTVGWAASQAATTSTERSGRVSIGMARTGPLEGHINRLKLIKRQGYGRAKFDLLRLRVLHHPRQKQQDSQQEGNALLHQKTGENSIISQHTTLAINRVA